MLLDSVTRDLLTTKKLEDQYIIKVALPEHAFHK